MLELNPHIESLKPSATLAINEQVKKLRRAGDDLVHFGFGQSPFPIPQAIVQALKKNADNNHYLPATGLPALKEELVRYLKTFHGIDREAQYIYPGPGSKELLFQTWLLLKGITFIPMGSWVSYGPQVTAKGGKYEVLPTEAEDQYKLTSAVLEEYCGKYGKEQKTLILNSPNNPTGAVYREKDLQQLAGVCRKHGVIVLSDEIYSLLGFEAGNSPSMAKYYPEGTIVYGGLSKIFSAGGYRFGFMSMPAEFGVLHTKLQSLFSETFSAVASPVQYAAIAAFQMSEDVREEIASNRDILQSVGRYVHEGLTDAGIRCTPPDGGFYILVDFEKYRKQLNALGLTNSVDLAHHLLNSLGIALLPGTDFYFEPSRLIFRLAYVDFDGAAWREAHDVKSPITVDDISQLAPRVKKGVRILTDFVKGL